MKMEESLMILEEKYDRLERKVEKLYKRLEQLDKKIEGGLSFKPIPVELLNNQAFIEEEKWISEQKSLYPNETIAFIKKEKELILLLHSDKEDRLLKKVDELIKLQKISDEDIIYFR